MRDREIVKEKRERERAAKLQHGNANWCFWLLFFWGFFFWGGGVCKDDKQALFSRQE